MAEVKIIDYKKKKLGTGDRPYFWLHVSVDGESWLGHWYPARTGFKNNYYGLDIRKHDETDLSWVRKAPMRSRVTSALVVAELAHHMAVVERGEE